MKTISNDDAAVWLVSTAETPPKNLQAVLQELGAGDSFFQGTSFGRGECDLNEFLRECNDCENGRNLPADRVPQSTYWLVNQSSLAIGIVRVRHRLNERLMQYGGHIGYYVAPAERGKGYGKLMLRLALEKARRLGIGRALLTVNPQNSRSRRVIVANGGLPDGLGTDPVTGEIVERFWIQLQEVPNPSQAEERLRRVTVGEPVVLNGNVELQDYSSKWPGMFERERDLIRSVLGERSLRIEHVGSTSVPGLVAKPIIDILLVVRSSADEPSYVPKLEAAGYSLRIREPDWHEHRMFNRRGVALNLHVFSAGSIEIERLLLLRDRLRENAAERQLYTETKRRLASQNWKYMQDYADAKSEVIEGIIRRARVGHSP